MKNRALFQRIFPRIGEKKLSVRIDAVLVVAAKYAHYSYSFSVDNFVVSTIIAVFLK